MLYLPSLDVALDGSESAYSTRLLLASGLAAEDPPYRAGGYRVDEELGDFLHQLLLRLPIAETSTY